MDFITFFELSKRHLGLNTLADIAREIGVTPQVVSNWKSRGVVPFKHAKILNEKIKKNITNDILLPSSNMIPIVEAGVMVEDGDIDYLKYFNVAYNYIIKIKFFIAKVCIIMSVIGFLYINLGYNYSYSSRAKFLPISNKSKAGSGNVASLLGVSLGASQENLSSSAIIPELIKSRTLAAKISLINFKVNKDSSSLAGETYHKKLSIHSYLKSVNVIKTRKSSIITLQFNSEDPYLSKIILDSVLKVLDDMVSEYKLSMIVAKKSFVLNRIDETFFDLTAKEESVKNFNEKNRNIYGSPKLILENARLAREVEVLTQVYISLKTQLEMISIDQSSNEKGFQVLDNPEVFSMPINRSKISVFILFIVSGIPIAIGLVFFYDWLIKNRMKLFKSV